MGCCVSNTKARYIISADSPQTLPPELPEHSASNTPIVSSDQPNIEAQDSYRSADDLDEISVVGQPTERARMNSASCNLTVSHRKQTGCSASSIINIQDEEEAPPHSPLTITEQSMPSYRMTSTLR